MATAAARVGLVKVCATEGGSYSTLECSSIDGKGFYAAAQMETTICGDAARRVASSGFFADELSIRGPYDASNAAMVILMAGLAGVWVEYLPNGTTGFKQYMATDDFALSVKAGADVMEFSCTLKPAGGAAPTAVT